MAKLLLADKMGKGTGVSLRPRLSVEVVQYVNIVFMLSQGIGCA